MPYYWSANAEHIVSLCRPWRTGDGCDPAALALAEERLGIALPAILAQFLTSWGNRFDLVSYREVLFSPEHFRISGDMLLCGQENQGCYVWGIPIAQITDADPPVHFVWWNWHSDQPIFPWKLGIRHLSIFLDYITYGNMFSGATKSASMSRITDVARLSAGGYRHIVLACTPPGLEPDPTWEWVIYQKDGIAIDPGFGSTYAVASSHELLLEAERVLGVVWEKRWQCAMPDIVTSPQYGR
ncbi:hypothetical protein F8S13_11355 [Chloroflexia bacterium SDU3-3]|nr:hypothetical protein F8S13_11355 [Chloroflexia bacterium SDU3-3]